MNLSILFDYLKGYVRVEVQGYFIERLMNLCKKNNIYLWGSRRKRTTLIEINVGIKNYKKFVKLAKETKCKAKIKNKKGIFFLFHRYKKRKVFFILFITILAIIIFLSNFIWNIQIEGNCNITNEEIIDCLKKEGISIGSYKNKLDTNNIVNNIRLKRNDIAWIGIEIKGTNVLVKVAESKLKPELIDEDQYCNIVAKKIGEIVKVNAINGTPLVKEGDIVKEGSVVIGGWLEGKYTGLRYVHANGSVQAKVWYTKKVKIDLKQVVSSKTGNSENKYSVMINNFQINFYKTLSKFKKYDTIIKKEKIKIFSDFYLPIEIVKTTNEELVQNTVEYSKDEAKKMATEEAKTILDKQLQNKDNLVNIYINYNETEEYIEAEVTYEVLEEIGTKEKIVF